MLSDYSPTRASAKVTPLFKHANELIFNTHSVYRLYASFAVVAVMISLLVYFTIPAVIHDTTKSIKATMDAMVRRLCEKILSGAEQRHVDEMRPGNEEEEDFSAADYLFVSTRVARAFPELVESAVILQYRSASVSADQRAKWTRAADEQASSWQLRRSVISIAWLQACAVAVALFIGSQALAVQEGLVYCIGPVVLGAFVTIGTFIIKFPIASASIIGGALLFTAGAYLAQGRLWAKSIDAARVLSSSAVMPLDDLAQPVEAQAHNNEVRMIQSSRGAGDGAYVSKGKSQLTSNENLPIASKASEDLVSDHVLESQARDSDHQGSRSRSDVKSRSSEGPRAGSGKESRGGSGEESRAGSGEQSKSGSGEESRSRSGEESRGRPIRDVNASASVEHGKYLRLDGVWVPTKEELIPEHLRFESDWNSDNDDELSLLYVALQEEASLASFGEDCFSVQQEMPLVEEEEQASYGDLVGDEDEREREDHANIDVESARNEGEDDESIAFVEDTE